MGPRATHRILLRAALASVNVFAWTFVFQYFFVRTHQISAAIAGTVLTYALAQIIAVLLTPYAAARLRHGYKWTIVFATLALMAAYTILAAAFIGLTSSLSYGIALFAILYGIYRGLYWVPYEVARALTPERAARHDLWLAVLPAAVGFVLSAAPMAPIFVLALAAVVVGLSLVPLSITRDMPEGYMWSYRGTFHELFSPSRVHVTAQSMLTGIEATALLLMWPLAMFMLFGWSYGTLGVVLMLTYIVTYALRGIFGRPLMAVSPELTAFSAASAWLLRLAVGGATGVILVDTFFYTGSQARARGIDMLSFEQAADNNTFVDEQTALKEIGMGIGRIMLCLFIAALASLVSVSILFVITFAVAGLAAGASVLLAHRLAHRFS